MHIRSYQYAIFYERRLIMNELQIFENEQFGQIRTVLLENEAWFVGKDIAESLGYENPQKAIRDHIDNEDKKIGERNVTPSIVDSLGREQYPTVINESGLYALVFGSKLSSAKTFKRWITHEVIPQIRKTGSYAVSQAKMVFTPDNIIQIAKNWKEEQEKRVAAEQQIETDRPLVHFAKSVAVTQNSMLIRELAKIITQNGYPMGEKRLFSWMRDNGYLIKKLGKDYNKPTQRSMDMKLFSVTETAITHYSGVQTHTTTRVTGKGQIYFINIFKTKASNPPTDFETAKALKERATL